MLTPSVTHAEHVRSFEEEGGYSNMEASGEGAQQGGCGAVVFDHFGERGRYAAADTQVGKPTLI